MTWQPIETAPRDDKPMFVIDCTGEWDIAFWHKDHVCGELSGQSLFTHWMRPEPPAEKRAE